MPNRVGIFLKVLLLLVSISGSSSGMKNERSPEAVQINCFPDKGLCVKIIEDPDMQIVFDMNPKPVRAMMDLVFTVALNKSGKPVTDADVTLDLSMPGMFMGMNRPLMKYVKGGIYEGRGVLPACPHGGKIWKAEVTVKLDNGPISVSYVFEVK